MAKAKAREAIQETPDDVAAVAVGLPDDDVPADEDAAAVAALDASADAAQDTRIIEVPLGGIAAGAYLSRHVEVRLSREQAIALKRLHLALRRGNAELLSGRPIVHQADAVRWLLEQIAG